MSPLVNRNDWVKTQIIYTLHYRIDINKMIFAHMLYNLKASGVLFQLHLKKQKKTSANTLNSVVCNSDSVSLSLDLCLALDPLNSVSSLLSASLSWTSGLLFGL